MQEPRSALFGDVEHDAFGDVDDGFTRIVAR